MFDALPIVTNPLNSYSTYNKLFFLEIFGISLNFLNTEELMISSVSEVNSMYL